MTKEVIETTPELVDYVLSESLMTESREKLHKRLDEICSLAIKALEQEPCEDCVSRQAVNTLIDELARAISDERRFISRGRTTATIMQDILDLPSVKLQEKTGHWIEVIDEIDSLGNTTWHHKCSICGNTYSGWGEYKHCPNCGARMEG